MHPGLSLTTPPVQTTEADSLKPEAPTPAFGRVRQPNPGSQAFPLSAALPRSALAPRAWKTKRWQMGSGLRFQDQGQTSTCVRYGITHLLQLAPVIRSNAFDLTRDLYQWAQRNDFWPGEEPTYYGTSVDAGLQFCRKEIKVISEYRWARSMDEVLGRLCIPASEGGGPLVSGADFYSNQSGRLETKAVTKGAKMWSPDGDYWGGHCTAVVGYVAKTAKRSARLLIGNSHEGNYLGEMEADAFEWLHFASSGELAAITELPR